MASIQAEDDLVADSDAELQYSSGNGTKGRPDLLYSSPERQIVVSIGSSTSSPLREPLDPPSVGDR